MTASPKSSVAAQLAALPTMTMKDLWSLWDAHFPRRPGTWNRDYVASRVAYKIQEAAHCGVDPTSGGGWFASANRSRRSASAAPKCI